MEHRLSCLISHFRHKKFRIAATFSAQFFQEIPNGHYSMRPFTTELKLKRKIKIAAHTTLET